MLRMGTTEITCPICGKAQKIENRECNQCFVEFAKGLDGTIAPSNRKYLCMVEDKEDMHIGVFRCV